MGDLQSAIKGLAEKGESAARDELKDIAGELKALRRISEEIQKARRSRRHRRRHRTDTAAAPG